MDSKCIGITTTIPIEVLLAAKHRVVDLNNLFITSGQIPDLLKKAESDGFPRSLCAWIKGLYATILNNQITEIVGVMEGDCSNTKSLTDVLIRHGVCIHPFSFPHDASLSSVTQEIDRFMAVFGVNMEQVEQMRQSLMPIREALKEIDRLTWQEGKVSGFENHLLQVSASDFNGDPDAFASQLKKAVQDFTMRPSRLEDLPLAYIGVPPMTSDLYDFVEKKGCRVVYNEVQREFAFPRASDCPDIYHQYADYTYPYTLDMRISEIKSQIQLRGVKGVLHYSQTFCHRAIEDIIFSKELGVPVLSITADRETELDARTRLRIESFLDMVQDAERGISL